MNRWVFRIIGLVILIVFLLMLFNLQRKLVELERNRRATKATTSTSR